MKNIKLQFSNKLSKYEFQGNIVCDDVVFTKMRGAYQQQIEFIKDGETFLRLFCDEYEYKNVLDDEYDLCLKKE